MKENKVHTTRLTEYEMIWIKAMRDLTKDSSSYIHSLWYSHLSTENLGLQTDVLIESILKNKDTNYKILLDMALTEFGKTKLVKVLNRELESVIEIGFEQTLSEDNYLYSYLKNQSAEKLRIHRHCIYSTDIERTIKEFEMFLKNRYEPKLEQYIAEEKNMEKQQYIPFALNTLDTKYFLEMIDHTITLHTDLQQATKESGDLEKILLEVKALKKIKEQLKYKNKPNRVVYIHCMFAELINYAFDMIQDTVNFNSSASSLYIETGAFYEQNPNESSSYYSDLKRRWEQQVDSYKDVIGYFENKFCYSESEKANYLKQIVKKTFSVSKV
ncbi:hypothetical protein ABEX78_21180 [Priestia megaterium]